MTAEKKKAIKDILTRAGKTFVQAFISALGIDSFFGVSGTSALKRVALSILVGALASGISAVWNSLLEWVTVRIDELEIDEFGEEIDKAMNQLDGGAGSDSE